MIHSGGDSKRVPSYSALGKLFSPVPHKLPNGKSSTLFDEFLIAMSSVPSRIREGMLLLSSAIIAWNKRMQELVRMDEIAKDIRYGKPVKETAALMSVFA